MTTREPMALDVSNDVEHLLRAVAAGELSSAQLPPGWPSERGGRKSSEIN